MNVISSQIGVLKNVLDVAALRHQAIAQNIANFNTPFYQRLEVAAEEGASPGSPGAGKPTVVVADGGEPRADGNNVSVEQEMKDLGKNALLFNTTVQILASRLASFRAAIS